MLRNRGLRSGLQRKASRNKPLTNREKRYNQLLGKQRYKIERVLGRIKRWLGGLEARYIRLAKTHGQPVLAAIAYSLQFIQTPGAGHVPCMKK
jgi:IS5 family transposase